MRQPKKTEWIVVMNAASAHVLADAEGSKAVFELEAPHESPRDKAGRNFSSGSPGRRATRGAAGYSQLASTGRSRPQGNWLLGQRPRG